MRLPLRLRDVVVASSLAVGCGPNETHPDRHALYDAGPAAPPSIACVPNLDGEVAASELDVAKAIGVELKFLVSPPGVERPVDLVGQARDGKQTWSYGTDLADDRALAIAPRPAEGAWYAASFPRGAFVTPFDAAGTIDAISSADAQGVYLLGLASAAPDPPEGKTLIVYDRPVVLYRFPLVVTAAWSTTANANDALVRGLPYIGKDTYDVKVDAIGELVLPRVTFAQVLRVRTTATLVPAVGSPVVTRTVAFVSECLGAVATFRSRPNEPAEDFTTAAEVRRFGF